MKVSGVEQFRQVYQGKAHRCIITDLNPRTNYRIRVAAGLCSSEVPKEISEVGEWSEIISVTTLDNQRISEWTIDDDTVSPFFMPPEGGSFNENSFISSYSSINNHNTAPTGGGSGKTGTAASLLPTTNDTFMFHKPAFVYGHHEWTFGKHFF